MDEIKMRTILTLLLILVETTIFAEALEHYGKPHEYYLKKPGYSDHKLKQDGECKSDQLTCVPQDDCELECPYGFNKLRNGGACYFLSNEEYNQKRTLHEAEDFCSKINSRLLWIEDSKELRELILFHKTLEETDNSNGTTGATESPDTNSTIPPTEDETTDEPLPEVETPATTESTMPSNMQMEPPLFFIGAEYDKTKGSWIWKETNDEIDWDILLYGTPNASESLKVIENVNINKCLVLNLTASGGLVQESECIASNGFICKMGVARSRCSKTSTTKCCFSPSYDFHKQNREYGFANLNLKPGGCQMKIGNVLLECEEVLSDIKNDLNETNHKYSVARIGSSYYYIANSTDDCIGREAIIQSEDVHTFVTSLFATRENYYADKNTQIGLTFMLEKRMAYWVNGKPDDFYEQFWLPGEPKRDDSVDGGCAAYANVQGTATYLWRLFSKEMCETFDKVCELPLFKGSISNRFEAENKCGKRHERGVLAKSVHSIYSTDEANFGEFPWQAAVMYPEKYGREIQRKFACSGALIHKSFVLTSAHCVTSVNVQKDFVVVLGQHDLNGESYILEPVVMDVKEVILHQDFNVRQSSLDDLALLQLDGEVDVDAHPHIGIGCLPDPEEIRSHGGDWECFITGWSHDNKRHGHQSILLKRLEAEFTSEEYCRYINRDYYNLISKKKRYQSYKRHNYYRSEDSELLCTTSANNKCLDDQSPLLVCKKATAYVQKPFYDKKQKKSSYFNGAEKSENYLRSFASSNEIHKPGINSYKEWYDYKPDDSIVNSYGEERFDSDKWYIIGIGNTMSECRDENYDYYNENHKYDKYGKPKRSEYSYEEFINKGKPHFRSSYKDVSNDYLNKENFKSYEKEFPEYSKPKSYKTENPRKITRDYNSESINKENEYSYGLKYKNRYDMAEVFTSVYDYINFIYYILDLHQ